MKKRELINMREREIAALKVTLGELQGKVTKVGIEVVAGQETNLAKARNLRRDIAQVKTIIRDKEIDKNKQA